MQYHLHQNQYSSYLLVIPHTKKRKNLPILPPPPPVNGWDDVFRNSQLSDLCLYECDKMTGLDASSPALVAVVVVGSGGG